MDLRDIFVSERLSWHYWLDKVMKQKDINYSLSKNLDDKWTPDAKEEGETKQQKL